MDKEFGVLSSSVPLQLLTSHFQTNDRQTKELVKKLQPEEINNFHYSKITKDIIDNGKCLPILTKLFKKSYEISKAYIHKPPKGLSAEEDLNLKNLLPDSPSYQLLEDDEMIFKIKGTSKPRLPPTGKISTAYKKKLLDDAFILPENETIDSSVTVTDNCQPMINTITSTPYNDFTNS